MIFAYSDICLCNDFDSMNNGLKKKKKLSSDFIFSLYNELKEDEPRKNCPYVNGTSIEKNKN